MAFKKITHGKRKMLLIFCGSDRLYWEFEEKFMGPFKDLFNERDEFYEISIVQNANHIFSFLEWQKEMLDITNSWIEKYYVR